MWHTRTAHITNQRQTIFLGFNHRKGQESKTKMSCSPTTTRVTINVLRSTINSTQSTQDRWVYIAATYYLRVSCGDDDAASLEANHAEMSPAPTTVGTRGAATSSASPVWHDTSRATPDTPRLAKLPPCLSCTFVIMAGSPSS